MKPVNRILPVLGRLSVAAWLLVSPLVHAAKVDLATSPLQTSTATLVKPNILYVLDDSGSMAFNYMPDWAGDYTAINALFYNAQFNALAYDPGVTYTPPVRYDGSTFPSMTSAVTFNWALVPVDGFRVQSLLSVNLSLLNVAYWYFTPGEYCTNATLRNCTTQSAPSPTYAFPAPLRWCTGTTQTSCQASRIDAATGVTGYTVPRYPGATYACGFLNLFSCAVPGSQNSVVIRSTRNSYPAPGSAVKAPSRTDCAGTTCTYNEEMTNYANWYAYYQTRMQATKTAISQAFSVLDESYRLGYMTINNSNRLRPAGNDFLNIALNTTDAGGQKQEWYDKLFAAFPLCATPLKAALSTAGRYYAGNAGAINNTAVTDPVQYACQRNYTMLSTDGYWNGNSVPQQIGNTAVGNQDGSLPRPYLDGNNTANTLADIAQYYYATDLRSTALGNATNDDGVDVSSNAYSNGQQRMNTYTIGLGASGYMQYQSGYANATSGDYFDVANGTVTSSATQGSGVCIWQASGACNWPVPTADSQPTIDDLWHAAVNGRGTYYSAINASELKAGLSDFLNNVNAISSSSAAPTVSTAKLVAGAGNFSFGTSFCSGKWFGDLARYSIDGTTGEPSATATWSQSGTGSDCSNATGGLTTAPLLDNRTVPRTIYTFDGGAGLQPFLWASMSATVQGYFKMAAIGGLSQLCASGPTCLPAAAQVDSSTAGTTTGAGGINLVNFLRGDRSNEGTTATDYYYARTHVLGDIVNSQPVYVQTPKASYADAGYTAFKTVQAARQGMVYVGANDGMLHAFNADTGFEQWAYIPSMLLPQLFRLADRNYPARHQFFADGNLVQDDVFINGAWRTILVGGLGGGGRGFYALDITSPTAPTLLWEFTSDTTKPAPYVSDADLGYSYGRPYITKLSDGTWVVLLTSGYNNVSPGSGRGNLWVLDARTGRIIQKLDTGVGTPTGGGLVAGCTVAPCPSGLSKISAYIDSAQNNTVTQVYGGDLYGNLWRFDLSSLTAVGAAPAAPQLLATLADASGNRQPITSRPEIGFPNGVRVVYVGTGSYLSIADISTTRAQTLYAVKDPLTSASGSLYGSPRANACSTASTSSNCFVRQSVTANATTGVRTASSSVWYSWSLATMNGWFIDLPVSGERIDTDPNLLFGTLVSTVNSPSTAGACSVGGYSYSLYVDYRTGFTVPGATNVGVVLSSAGLSSAATLVQTTGGQIVAITRASDGSTVTTNIPVSTTGGGTRRISWRRLTDSQ